MPADWGDPDWALAALATPAGERVADAGDAARAALEPWGAPVTLLRPARFALSQPLATRILQTYACLAAIRPTPIEARGKPWAVPGGSDIQRAGFSREAQIGEGARQAGVSPRYLVSVASAESGLSTYARARTSSAAGLFQFVDQTWLRTLRRYGPALGLAREAEAIRIGPGGRAWISDPLRRAEILALRYDPQVAAQLAGALTRENAATLRTALGRAPTDGELYAAHLLGPGQALILVSTDQVAPGLPARLVFPAAAASNHALFYAGAAPRSVREVAGLIADRASVGVRR